MMPTCGLLSRGPPPKRRGRGRQAAGKLNSQDWHRGAARGSVAENPPLPLYPAWVWPLSLTRRVRRVALLTGTEGTQARDIVRAAPEVAWAGRTRVEDDVARGQIAGRCRDRTPGTGRADGQARAEPVRDCHCPAALATRKLARGEALHPQPALRPRVFSLARGQPRHFKARVLAVCIATLALAPLRVNNPPSYEHRSTYGASAA